MRFFARLSSRLLTLNLLLVCLPIGGLLWLGAHEQALWDEQERAVAEQGRLLAAALSGSGPLARESVERIFKTLHGSLGARLRVIDRERVVIGDSDRLAARRDEVSETLDGKEIRAALAGREGQAIRATPGQHFATLVRTFPIQSGGQVVGVAVVSQDGERIQKAVGVIRLRIVEVGVLGVAVALVLSLLVSTSIARPLRRLRDEAEAIVDRRGRLKGAFRASQRPDEIGDLSRSLEELTRRLEEHVRGLETFASDVAHELKNPLASIRTAAEMLSEVGDPGERRRFLTIVLDEVARMENQLSELAEITRIDARLDGEAQEPVPVNGLLERIAERLRIREGGRVRFVVDSPPEIVTVHGSPSRLTQVFENILDNAASFSPEGGCVRITLARSSDGAAVIGVRDEGSGIPQAHQARIFDRFFSYRPESGRGPDRPHAGLGLAIVKAIVEGYGGRVTAANNPDRGATFTVWLPASRTGTFSQAPG
jgi:two-component system, OmpR family, sensor histidine kinase ChvG